MALTKTNIGTNEDGSPRFLFQSDLPLIVTGPWIKGIVTSGDDHTYNLTDDVVEVAPGHVAEVAHLVGLRYEDEGHPLHLPTAGDPHPEPFVHLCTPAHCGRHVRKSTHPLQALALARAEQQMRGIIDPHHAHLFGQAMGLIDPKKAPPASMALASVTAENAALNGLDGTGSTNVIPFGSLHTATPGTTGASENANAGSYVRLALAMNAAASGSKTNSGSQTYSTLGTIAVSHLGSWSSVTYGAGTYAIGAALTASVTSTSITIASGGASWSAT